MPPRRTSRIYTRTRGGAPRFYGDFRDFSDVGGSREPLVPEGSTVATADPDVAAKLATERVQQLEEARRNRTLLGIRRVESLASYAAKHMITKAREGQADPGWLATTEKHLAAAIEFFNELTPRVNPHLGSEAGAERDLTSIGVGHIKAYRQWLAQRPSQRGEGVISGGTQRHYLNALGNLFAAAIEEEIYEKANPVHALSNKPIGDDNEAEWLEVWEAALLIESARTYPYHSPADTLGLRLGRTIVEAFGPGEEGIAEFARKMAARGKTAATPKRIGAYLEGKRVPAATWSAAAAEVLGIEEEWLGRGDGPQGPERPDPVIYPLLCTWLLTGGRMSEVTGLELDDVSFTRRTVSIRPNEWRRLKTRQSRRVVPLWPQLAEVLKRYIDEERPKDATLLFPSPRLLAKGKEGMIRDPRAALDTIAARVGWKAGEIRTKMFRHTYISTRLQTLDRGAPVQPWTVAREVGHQDFDMINRIYGHLQQVRHRSEAVEYRIEHFEELEEVRRRLRPLRAA